jgi:hypothetical protein
MQRLSSEFTTLLKVTPLLIIVFCLMAAVSVFLLRGPLLPALGVLTTGTVYASLLFWMTSRDLMDEVWLDESSLLVRYRGREERIDLVTIVKISDDIRWGQPRITLTLREPCGFGSAIAFRAVGAAGNFIFLRRNVVARELADRVEVLRHRAAR